MRPRTLVILGSTRQGRAGEQVGHWLMGRLQRRPEADFELVDLRDHPLPFFDHPVPPASGQYAPEAQGWARTVGAGDGYVILTPEYNHGYPAVLKNALDHVYHEWNHKPVAFVSYGGSSGGLRAAEQLRTVAVELRMAPIREQLAIPFVLSAFDESGQIRQPDAEQALDSMTDELLWWTRALAKARPGDRAVA